MAFGARIIVLIVFACTAFATEAPTDRLSAVKQRIANDFESGILIENDVPVDALNDIQKDVDALPEEQRERAALELDKLENLRDQAISVQMGRKADEDLGVFTTAIGLVADKLRVGREQPIKLYSDRRQSTYQGPTHSGAPSQRADQALTTEAAEKLLGKIHIQASLQSEVGTKGKDYARRLQGLAGPQDIADVRTGLRPPARPKLTEADLKRLNSLPNGPLLQLDLESVPDASDSPTKQGGSLPLWPIGAGLGIGAMGYAVARSRGTYSSSDDPPPAATEADLERVENNRYHLKIAAAAAAIGFSLVYGGRAALRIVAPTTAALSQRLSASMPEIASEAGAINPSGGKTVWDSIKATDDAWPGTQIPRSFEIAVKNGRFWVNPNATEHMYEFLTSGGDLRIARPPLQNQALLESFQAALEKASSEGIQYGRKMDIGDWQFVFSKRANDALPVVKHALYRH